MKEFDKQPLVIHKKKIVSGSPSQIWKIITTPKYFEDWMYVPGMAVKNEPLQLNSKIQWINDDGIVYLEGTVINLIPEQKLEVALQDISWKETKWDEEVMYSFSLQNTPSGTLVEFYLGDLSIDPEAEKWFDAYNSSDEIGAIERLINIKDK